MPERVHHRRRTRTSRERQHAERPPKVVTGRPRYRRPTCLHTSLVRTVERWSEHLSGDPRSGLLAARGGREHEIVRIREQASACRCTFNNSTNSGFRSAITRRPVSVLLVSTVRRPLARSRDRQRSAAASETRSPASAITATSQRLLSVQASSRSASSSASSHFARPTCGSANGPRRWSSNSTRTASNREMTCSENPSAQAW